MKLIKCHVASFGKLKDFTYDFSSGLNIVLENNGWGKSTFAWFVKSMFYGMVGRKQSILENERKRFLPWGSTDIFGGYLIYEIDGTKFKVERFFGKKEADDTFSLTNLETGKQIESDSNLGQNLFGVDEEGFLSTIYFSEKDLELKSNATITAKFNMGNTEDTEAYLLAVKNLTEKAKEYNNANNKGIISDLKQKLFINSEQIEKVESSSAISENIEKEISNLKLDYYKLKEQEKEIREKLEVASRIEGLKIKRETYNKLLNEKQVLESKIKEVDGILNGNRPTEQELSILSATLRDLHSEYGRKEEYSLNVEQYQNKLQEIPPVSKRNNLFLILSLAFLLVSIGLSFASIFVASIPFIAFLVFGILYFTVQNKVESEQKFLVEKLLIESRQKYETVLGGISSAENDLRKYFSRFNLPFNSNFYDSLELIRNKSIEFKNYTQNLDRINKDIENFGEISNDKIEESNFNVEELKSQLSILTTKLNSLSDVISTKISLCAKHTEIASTLVDLINEKEQLTKKLSYAKEHYDLIKNTLEFLKMADENLKIKYRKPLTDSINKFYGILHGNEKTVMVDVDLNATIEEKSGAKDSKYYSKGSQVSLDICKRLALIDVIFTNEKPFIILDDPFSSFDENKINASVELVKKLSEHLQIIYLTCHKSRAI